MKKNFLKNWSLIFSSVVTLTAGVYAYGCADGWWGYDYSSSFAPEYFVDNSYKPLFYSPYERFYNNDYLSNYTSKHNEDIVQDWKNYLGNTVPSATLKAYLITDSLNMDIQRFHENSKNKLSSSLNTSDKKVKKFLDFLYYAKMIEDYSTQTYDYWNYENRLIENASQSIVDEVEKFYKKADKGDEFFANRMWFQVLKAKFYSDNRASVISFFEETKAKQPQNLLYSRALSYVAGAYHAQKDFIKANLYYAEIFNREPKLRHETLYNFRPMDKKELNTALASTKDKDIQAAIWAMSGYYQDEAACMKEIYALNPKSPHIDYLLTRWVNIQESAINVFMDKSLKSTAEYQKEIKGKIDQKTLTWINDVASKPEKLNNPALWNMAAGYLNIFQGEHQKAKSLFDKALKTAGNDKNIKNEARLFNLINEVSQIKTIDDKAQSTLITDLNWLFYEVPQQHTYDSPFRYNYASSWIKQYISAVYRGNKNPLMAELVNSDRSYYLVKDNVAAMEQFFLRKNKTAWEEMFVGLYDYNLSDINESNAIYLFYQDKVDAAIAEMEKTTTAKGTYYDNTEYTILYKDLILPGNPFNGKIKDCNDCDHMAKQTVTYTKISFLKKVKEMQDKIKAGDDVYNNALLVGNAFYNASYFGNARTYYYNKIIGEYGNGISAYNQPYLMSMKQVRKYYEMALKAAQTNEQKAKMSYLLAKVERNEFYNKEYFSRDYYYGYGEIMIKKWQGFKDLQTKYADTKYYQDVINECGYFRKYLGI